MIAPYGGHYPASSSGQPSKLGWTQIEFAAYADTESRFWRGKRGYGRVTATTRAPQTGRI